LAERREPIEGGVVGRTVLSGGAEAMAAALGRLWERAAGGR